MRPSKILLSNIAHLGDVVLMTSVIKPLKKRFPDSEFGFLIGSWAKELLPGEQLHFFDHMRLNRSKQKVKRHFETMRCATEEMRDYDIAIDLYPFFPNSAYLLKKANIPMRVGFTNNGLGHGFTHAFKADYSKGHITDNYRQILRLFDCEVETFKPHLQLSAKPRVKPPYVVVHPGAGGRGKRRSWSEWKEMIDAVGDQTIVFTGKGEESHLIKLLMRPGDLDLCNKLSISELYETIKGADFFIGVDSFASHLAAIAGVASKVLFESSEIKRLWQGLPG